jgi:hypothetical protein
MSSRSHGGQLLKYLAAVTIVLDHPCYAACLTFDAPNTSQQLGFGFSIG